MKEIEELEKNIDETLRTAKSVGRWQVAAVIAVGIAVAAIIRFFMEVAGK